MESNESHKPYKGFDEVRMTALRQDLSDIISKHLASGMKTADLIVTILDLARIAAEGSLLTVSDEARPRVRQALHDTLQEMAKNVMTFTPPSDAELEKMAVQVAKRKQGKSAWTKH